MLRCDDKRCKSVMKREAGPKCRRNRDLSNTVNTEPTQPAKLLLMLNIDLLYTLNHMLILGRVLQLFVVMDCFCGG